MTDPHQPTPRPIVVSGPRRAIDRSDDIDMFKSSTPTHPGRNSNDRYVPHGKGSFIDRPSFIPARAKQPPAHVRAQRRYRLILAPHIDRVLGTDRNPQTILTERQYLTLVNPVLLHRIDTAAALIRQRSDTATLTWSDYVSAVTARVAKTAQRAAERKQRRVERGNKTATANKNSSKNSSNR